MNLLDFEIGKMYEITTKDWDAPDGSGTVPGKTRVVTILPAQEVGEAMSTDGICVEPASAAEVVGRKQFLRVQRPDGKSFLLHPETIKSASLLS